MKKEEISAKLSEIVKLKIKLMQNRFKASSGEKIPDKENSSIRKQIARIYTELNKKK